MNKNHTKTDVTELPFCDICIKKPAAYDSRLKSGAWGYMCEDCFEEFGVGLGEGKGQKLILVDKFEIKGAL